MEGTVSAAFALARKWGADVHLLEVVPPRGPSLLDDKADIRLGGRITSKRDWSRLEDSIHAAERAHIHVRPIAYRGDATIIITSYVQLVKARLLVIGKHYGTPRWRRNTRRREHPQPRCTCSRARSAATTPDREEPIAFVRSYRFGRRLYGRVRSGAANGHST